MVNINQNDEFIQKLKNHLRTLFQFDSTELDFGIYRIMNYKRQEIESFIENDLIKAVGKEFEKYKTLSNQELAEKIQKVENKIKEDFGSDFLHNGKLIEKYGETKIVKEYLELKKQVEEMDLTEGIQAQVFNDLYNFFSRYYEDGDFVSKRRYSSKQHKYAIPYNGEEVKLYWANFDQYYVKTGEIFKDYEFNQKGWKFIFRTVLAEIEAGDVKGERRYFFLSSNAPVKIENKTCFIEFEYRPLTDKDSKQYPVKTKEGKTKTTGITQDELNPILKDKILDSITPLEPKAVLEIASPSARNDNEETLPSLPPMTCLEKHLYKYTRKVTSDFFIHKNLKDFLERELDYFIKTEVLDIESLDTERERYFDRHITRAKVVKNIGKRIIEFLSQIEDFQKMLWEKKKFVLRTDYVITIDRIPNELHQEILRNKEQLKEWEDLGFGKIQQKEDLIARRDLMNTEYKKLPVDTKYFSEEFTERLLERLGELGNLDDLIDGILIKSENWQALNLILGKYKEKVQCIYIDPPFNTGTNEFLYKNKYLDSSWISMMYDRLDSGKNLLKNDGSIYVRIDYHGNYYTRFLMDMVFGEENFRNEIVVKRGSPKAGLFLQFDALKSIGVMYDNLYWFSKSPESGYEGFVKKLPESRKSYWTSFKKIYDRPTMRYEILGINLKKGQWMWNKERAFKAVENYKRYLEEYEKTGETIEEYWLRTGKKLEFVRREGDAIQYWVVPKETTLLDNDWLDIPGYSSGWGFTTENSEQLLKRVIESTSNQGDLVMDYFLGSGTTTAVAHKLKRKWIGIEMGEHFWTVVLPRMKKVLAGDKSGVSKEVNWQGGGFFKYHYLEQYEDTLHNIEFPQEEKGQKMLTLFPEEAKTEYLMKYMLKFETEGSPSLLNLKQFENPFEYKLKIISNRDEIASPSARNDKMRDSNDKMRNGNDNIVNVDLVETFNYLIGLKINGYRFLNEGQPPAPLTTPLPPFTKGDKGEGRKYVIVLGERNNRRTAVVWRPIKDIDLEKDKEIIGKVLKSYNPDEIFINGDSFVEGYKPVESEFKALAGV